MEPTVTPASTEIIYHQADIKILVGPTATAVTVSLLKRTVYGTHGPQYRHTSHDEKINHLQNPFFFGLFKEERLIGTYCLSQRLVKTPAGQALSFYGRYFSIEPDCMGQGYGRLLKKEALAYIKRTVPPPFLFYSYIEETNQRSLEISKKDGYRHLGSLEAILFSRLYPKQNEGFTRLPPDEQPHMLTLLQAAYQAYTFVQFDPIFFQQNYFVLKENDEIIAGVQANPVAWHILHLPGLSGKFVMQVLPHLPVLRRLINAANYRFLALEGLYVKPGREKDLYFLLESTLAHFGCN